MTSRYHSDAGLAAGCLLAISGTLSADSNVAPVIQDTTPADTHITSNHSPTIHGLEQARRRPDGILVISGRLSGTGHVLAKDVIIEGELSPGHSPGCIDFGGDVTFNVTSTLVTEIGGTTPCTEHDRVDVAGQLTINGATLEVILINGFVPAWGDTFDILNWGSLSGTFGTIDTSAAGLPYPLQWETSTLYTTGVLSVGVQAIADGDLAPWDSPDTHINAADLMIAIQLALGYRTAGALQLAHGDMDGDGGIDLTDLLMIQLLVVP